MATVGSLWVGGPLGFVQKLCLSSFVYYGHEVKLYVYDMDMKVPNGVVKHDANEIVPEEKIFKYNNQLAAFSDYFRYRMIKSQSIMWVDADTLCLTEDFFSRSKFVFISESDTMAAGGILKIPSDHIMLDKMINQSEEMLKIMKDTGNTKLWTMMGPSLITKMVGRYDLWKHAYPAEQVNLLDHWSKSEQFWDPKKKKKILEIADKAYCGTFFTGALRMKKFDTEQLPPKGSAIEHFAKKFGAI
jgi:hypothetical protein